MRTSETVMDAGLYASECCGEELIFKVGDVFQRCPRCMGLCVWESEDQFVPVEEPEVSNPIAA